MSMTFIELVTQLVLLSMSVVAVVKGSLCLPMQELS